MSEIKKFMKELAEGAEKVPIETVDENKIKAIEQETKEERKEDD